MWGLWWTKRHWGRFSQSISVSPANHSTDFSIIIITRGWHKRPLSGRSVEWILIPPPTMQIKKKSSVVKKLWTLLNENVIKTKFCRHFGHPREEIRTKDWWWSRMTARLPVLNVWRYIPLPLIFGRFINASVRTFPWRGLPKYYFQFLCPQRILLQSKAAGDILYFSTWPFWLPHPLNYFPW
jgi:hypothetical protein